MAVGLCYVVSHRLRPGPEAEYSKNLSGGDGSGGGLGPQTRHPHRFNPNTPNRAQDEEVV